MLSFYSHCDEFGKQDVEVSDWLIPDDELEGARQIGGIQVTDIHCGNQHELLIRERDRVHLSRRGRFVAASPQHEK